MRHPALTPPWILDDPRATLATILEEGGGRVGRTLVAHVDRETQDVLGVRHLLTPEPLPHGSDERAFSDARLALSDALHEIAHDLVPDRTWTRERWSPVTGELFTVVCREGRVVDTALEWQFVAGWRYANHNTAAVDGDVYVVTPHGWTGILDERAGLYPALATRPRLRACPAPGTGPRG